MSTVTSVNSTPSNQAANFLNTPTPVVSTAGPKTLGIDDFLKLITTQLTQQDPLKPMEDTQFISQMASFTSLQQMQTLSKDFESFTSNQKELGAQDYLGKTVTVQTSAGTVTGPVTAISFDQGSPLISVNGGTFDPANIISISTGSPQTTSSNPPASSSGKTN